MMIFMDRLDLDPGTYRGTYKLLGGRPSLDLVSTVSWPGSERAHDWLDSVDNVQRWVRAVGLPAFRFGTADLAALNDLRADITAVLRPLARGDQPARKAIEALNRRIAQAS